jgi:hypothetical protein
VTKTKGAKNRVSALHSFEGYIKPIPAPRKGQNSYSANKRPSAATIQSLPFQKPGLVPVPIAVLAGAAGLEPATCGFGDRRSTN